MMSELQQYNFYFVEALLNQYLSCAEYDLQTQIESAGSITSFCDTAVAKNPVFSLWNDTVGNDICRKAITYTKDKCTSGSGVSNFDVCDGCADFWGSLKATYANYTAQVFLEVVALSVDENEAVEKEVGVTLPGVTMPTYVIQRTNWLEEASAQIKANNGTISS